MAENVGDLRAGHELWVFWIGASGVDLSTQPDVTIPTKVEMFTSTYSNNVHKAFVVLSWIL